MKAAISRAGGVSIENVPDPVINDPGDAIVKITRGAICASDLHIYRGHFQLKDGDGLGHEFVGVVEEVGSGVRNFQRGQRVIGPFWVSCGECEFCLKGLTTSCVRGGCFGFGDILGGYPGCQAEYVCVPLADGTLYPIPDSLEGVDGEELTLFLGDNVSTGYHGAVRGEIKPGNVVVVIGDGAVGQFATYAATLFGPARVITVGHHDYRLDIATRYGADTVINSKGTGAVEAVMAATGGRGADVVVECVGTSDSITEAIAMVRPGGTVSAIGLFWEPYQLNITDMFLRNFTLRAGVAPSRTYINELLPLVENGRLDPRHVISHRIPLAEVPQGYEMMDKKLDNALKIVIVP